MPTESQQTVEQFLFTKKNRLLWLVPFLILSVIFLLILSQSYSLWGQGNIVLQVEWWNVIAIFLTSIGFILCKAGALFFSARAAGGDIGFRSAAKLLTQSVLVEITMFPSKVAGDTFKYFRLPTREKAQKVMTVVLFRCTSFSPFLLLLVLYPDSVYSWFLCGLLLVVSIWIILKKTKSKILWTAVFYSVCGHFLALLFWAFQGYLLLRMLSPSDPGFFYFIGIFLIAQIVAAASNLPFGVGVKEVLFGFTLSSFLGADQLIIFLILQRLSGELLTALIGWLTMFPEIFKRRLNARSKDLCKV